MPQPVTSVTGFAMTVLSGVQCKSSGRAEVSAPTQVKECGVRRDGPMCASAPTKSYIRCGGESHRKVRPYGDLPKGMCAAAG